jgi:hypothetical protein
MKPPVESVMRSHPGEAERDHAPMSWLDQLQPGSRDLSKSSRKLPSPPGVGTGEGVAAGGGGGRVGSGATARTVGSTTVGGGATSLREAGALPQLPIHTAISRLDASRRGRRAKDGGLMPNIEGVSRCPVRAGKRWLMPSRGTWVRGAAPRLRGAVWRSAAQRRRPCYRREAASDIRASCTFGVGAAAGTRTLRDSSSAAVWGSLRNLPNFVN